MGKSLQDLQKLAANPFYTLSDAEADELKRLEAEQNSPKAPTDPPRKGGLADKEVGAAPVKETGKLNKQNGDPKQAE